MGGLYNGQPIPKAGEIWDTDKANAVDLIEKGYAEPVNLLQRKQLIQKLERKNHSAYSLWRYEKEEKEKRI